MNTTIRISEETNDLLKNLKLKYRYKSMDEIVNDTSKYFIEYNLSPRNSSKPIIEQFDRVDKTFRSFFKEYETKMFKPFVNAQSQVNLRLLNFIENPNIEKKNELNFDKNNEEKDNISSHYFSDIEYQKMKDLIKFLDEKIFTGLKQDSREDGTYYSIHTYNFFGLKDIFNDVENYFKK